MIESREDELIANIDASRGCLFNCSYCHVNPYHSCSALAKRDLRDIDKVVDDIEILYKKYGKRFFVFNDSHFWMGSEDNQRAIDFCSELKKRQLNIHFYIYLRCNPFPPEHIIYQLAQCGLSRVFLGVENASERALRLFQKGSNSFDDFFAVQRVLLKYNINIHIGYIVFNPLLTMDELKLNIEYLFQLKKLVRIGIIHEQIRIIPNSKFYKLLKRENLLTGEKSNYKSVTYGYEYKFSEVQEVYNLVDRFYTITTHLQPYDVEYYCVSGILLKDLCVKDNIVIEAKILQDFVSIYDEINLWMYNFLKRIVILVEEDSILPDSEWGEIKSEYEKLYLRCQLYWSNLVVDIRKKSPDLTGQIYRGVE